MATFSGRGLSLVANFQSRLTSGPAHTFKIRSKNTGHEAPSYQIAACGVTVTPPTFTNINRFSFLVFSDKSAHVSRRILKKQNKIFEPPFFLHPVARSAAGSQVTFHYGCFSPRRGWSLCEGLNESQRRNQRPSQGESAKTKRATLLQGLGVPFTLRTQRLSLSLSVCVFLFLCFYALFLPPSFSRSLSHSRRHHRDCSGFKGSVSCFFFISFLFMLLFLAAEKKNDLDVNSGR